MRIPSVPRRGQLTLFVDTHVRVWDTTLALLAVLYVALATLSDNDPHAVPVQVLYGLSALFLIEFVARLWDSPFRWLYVRSHWMDAVACIPFVGALRGLRVLRLLRIAAGLRVLRSIELLDQDAGGRASFWFIWPSLLVLWLGGSYAIWLVDRVPRSQVNNFGDALYLTFVSVTTVGYGDAVPKTAAAKVIVGILVFIGIGFLGFVSARLTAWW